MNSTHSEPTISRWNSIERFEPLVVSPYLPLIPILTIIKSFLKTRETCKLLWKKKENVESSTLQSEKSGLKRIAGGLEVDPRGCIPADRRTTGWFWFSVCWSLLVGSHAWPSDEIISSPRTWPCLIYIPRRFYCSRSAGWDTRSGLGPRKRGEARNAGNWISSLSRAQQYPWRYCCRAGFAPLCIRCEWHA